MLSEMKKVLVAAALFLNALTCFAGKVEFEEDFSLPVVYINLINEVGSAHDPLDKSGLAHVANQMFLRGTQNHQKLQFFELLNQLGGQLEVDVRNEGTVIRGAVLAENIDRFLELLEEALTRPKFTADELAKLKKEVEGEILERKGNDTALVQYHFTKFLYGSHPYGNPIMGTRKGVSSITSTDIVNFYTQYYGGDTIQVFGSGAVKSNVVEKWFTRLSDKLTAIHPEAKPAFTATEPVLEKGRRALIVDKPNATQSQVLLGGKGMRPEADGFYAVLLANHSFGGASFQARLMQEVRVKRGWTYGASSNFRFGKRDKHMAMYVFPKTSDTVPAVDLTLKLYEDLLNKGITQEEYKFAKSSLVNNAPFNYDTSKKRLENATNEYLINFPRGYFRDFADNIDRVDFGDIAPALKKNLGAENLALTIVGDAKKLKAPVSKIPGFTKVSTKNYLED